ncbi:hypothetical protein [Curtobacterium poinsettiae]|uniref:hypothetical protein n=1 Tax=Curtobacterium poinsettiae TaxID=159612 RepID=UPI001BDDE650|nr:hypothetical protein [Curtobacterium flaccumfaciens]MBT1611876.1 hypothetical protein [Curtobacterium flaccumfaciens pv. poinsettiae]
MTDYIWDDPSIEFPDWQGNVQLDQRKTGVLLNDLIGLDFDRWFIVGLHVTSGERKPKLHVLAVDREIFPPQAAAPVIQRVAAAHGGEVPVTDFEIHDADPYVILQAMTHWLDFRLRHRSIAGLPIRVTASDSVPSRGSD